MHAMNDQPSRLSACLAAARAALRRAFTASRGSGAAPGFETETTLFGGLSEQPRTATPAPSRKDEFWDASGGESSYFADAEPGRKDGRR